MNNNYSNGTHPMDGGYQSYPTGQTVAENGSGNLAYGASNSSYGGHSGGSPYAWGGGYNSPHPHSFQQPQPQQGQQGHYYSPPAPHGSDYVPVYPPQQPGMAYGTPPVGSLGTPHGGPGMWVKGRGKGRSRPQSGSVGGGGVRSVNSHGSFSSTVGSVFGAAAQFAPDELKRITLVPTRPLLKALAKHCRPNPPWCVGNPAGVALPLSDELMRFGAFVNLTDEEAAVHAADQELIAQLFREVFPDAELVPMGATAAGQPLQKAVTAHYYLTSSHDEGEDTKKRILAAVVGQGGQVEFAVDDRDVPCAVCTNSRTGKRSAVRYGEKAVMAAECARLLQDGIAAVPERRAAFCALLALLEQNKVLNDTGVQRTMLSGEAVAVMLLAVVNSYGGSDVPDSGRLLMDFFLTFGFEANFNFVTSCVTVKGLRPSVAKKHTNAQLDVVDPGSAEINLTPNLDRVASLQAVFNYCYTALSQYQHISSSQRRAQSTMSTIIGGEPYWVRVLKLYHENVEPFYSIVEAKKAVLALGPVTQMVNVATGNGNSLLRL